MTNYSLIYVKLFYTGLSISFQLHYLQLQHISRLPKSFLHSYMYTFAALKTGNVLLRKCLISRKRFKTKILSSSIKNSYTKALLWWTFTVIAIRVFFFIFSVFSCLFQFFFIFHKLLATMPWHPQDKNKSH